MKRLAFVLVLPAALAAPASASARTVPLDWNEQWLHAGKTTMTFRIDALVVQGNQWAVSASFTNRSREPIRVGHDFALALFRSRTDTQRLHAVLLSANAFQPRAPRTLAAGATWSGAFGGGGIVRRGAYVRVVLGNFAGPSLGPHGFDWLTRHVRKM